MPNDPHEPLRLTADLKRRRLLGGMFARRSELPVQFSFVRKLSSARPDGPLDMNRFSASNGDAPIHWRIWRRAVCDRCTASRSSRSLMSLP
jgi:hypothetical protein